MPTVWQNITSSACYVKKYRRFTNLDFFKCPIFICNDNLPLQNSKIFHPKIECMTENVQKQSIIYALGKYT